MGLRIPKLTDGLLPCVHLRAQDGAGEPLWQTSPQLSGHVLPPPGLAAFGRGAAAGLAGGAGGGAGGGGGGDARTGLLLLLAKLSGYLEQSSVPAVMEALASLFAGRSLPPSRAAGGAGGAGNPDAPPAFIPGEVSARAHPRVVADASRASASGRCVSQQLLTMVCGCVVAVACTRVQVARRLSATSSTLLAAYVEAHGRQLSLMVRRSMAATSWLHHKVSAARKRARRHHHSAHQTHLTSSLVRLDRSRAVDHSRAPPPHGAQEPRGPRPVCDLLAERLGRAEAEVVQLVEDSGRRTGGQPDWRCERRDLSGAAQCQEGRAPCAMRTRL